jgi:asparagine synthase (glutamine-hydrolysing)
MANSLAHRGPDGYGIYHSGVLAFGQGRLAIIDLSAPAGPIFSEDRRTVVAYNGEVYNYKSLRAELEQLGHVFATQTDTEVVVHAYESWGVQVFSRLRGMFALAIWDEDAQRLLLARDRLGEKPLYYSWNDGAFLFASEIKALFEESGLRRAVNRDALLNYLAVGYSPPPDTLFEGIQKLAPGEFMVIDRSGSRKARYWQAVMDTRATLREADTVRQVREVLTQAVEMRLMSDVPLGTFLSGGVDSTAVTALTSRAVGHPVQTFTVGFDFEPGSKGDAKFNVDARYAALAAQRLGTDHHLITIKQDNSLAELFPRLVYAMDEPVVQPAIIQTVHVSALARMHGVPVLLSGDAGDELFAGYPHYRMDRLLERYLRIPGLLRQTVLTPLLEHMPARFDGLHRLAKKSRSIDPVRRYLEWMRIVELDRLPGLLSDERQAASAYGTVGKHLRPLLTAPQTPYFADRIAFASLNLWIAEDSNMRVDKMSMAMSVESRAPLEDHPLVELAFRIPLGYKLRGGDFKRVLKRAVADLVPPEILARPKWGFAPPSSEWLRTVLRPLVDKYLSPENVREVGLFRPEAVSGLIHAHMTKRSYELWSLWALLVFHVWHALYIEQSLKLESRLQPHDFISEELVTTASYTTP